MICCAIYTSICFIRLVYHKIHAMGNINRLFLKNGCILPKWPKDSEDQSECLLTYGVKNILDYMRDAEGIVLDIQEEDIY